MGECLRGKTACVLWNNSPLLKDCFTEMEKEWAGHTDLRFWVSPEKSHLSGTFEKATFSLATKCFRFSSQMLDPLSDKVGF